MSELLVKARLATEVAGMRSVLDVGCGPGQYLRTLPVDLKYALEANKNYVCEVNADAFYLGTAQDLLPKIPNGHADVVMALDFIEHLVKSDALFVIAEMQRIALRKVIMFTPDGFHPQGPAEPNASRYTEYEWQWQTHRSGWTADEFEVLGFVVDRWDFDYGKGAGFEKSLWAVWTR